MPVQLEVDFETKRQSGIDEEVFQLLDAGVSREQSIEKLGISTAEFDRWTRTHGVKWPADSSPEEATTKAAARKRTVYWIRMRGEYIPLSEAARLRNRPYNVVLERFKRGERGAELFRPVRPYRVDSQPDEGCIFYLGISEEKWFEIMDYARAKGMREAAVEYDVPKDAVEAALNGEMERLD